MRLRASPAALLLWALASAAALTGQEGAEAETTSAAAGADASFMDVVDVNVVNVEVHVTNKQGEPVIGLTREDFVVLEDKKPVEITNFYAVTGGESSAESDAEPAAAPPEDPLALGKVETVPEDQLLHLVLYVDNFNIRPFHRNRVLRAARVFLRSQLGPSDRVMLLSYNRSLKVVVPFTRSKEAISTALFDLEEMSAYGVHYDSDRRDILRDIYEAQDIYQVRGRASQYAESILNDLKFSLDALKETVEMLAGLPGRKAILYISDGMSMTPAEDIYYALNDRFVDSQLLMESQRFNAHRDFQELTAKANTNGVTFHTIDAAGLRSYTYLDASNPSPDGGSLVDRVHFENVQAPIRFLARETGGRSMLNNNNFVEQMETIAADFRNYYSLGYETDGRHVGRYKRIKVKLKEPQKCKGCRVRHRQGYRDRPVEVRMADTTMAALHFGYSKNQLGVELEFGRGERQENGHYLVPLQVRIPLGKLEFLRYEDLHRGSLRLFVASKDEEGGLAEVAEVPVGIEIPASQIDAAKDKLYQYELKLLMRRGGQIVAVGVRDEYGASSAFVTRAVTVGS